MKLIQLLEQHFTDSLTEELKAEFKTMFEAAVTEAVKGKEAEQRKELEAEYKAELTSFKESFIGTVSNWFEKSFTDWLNVNKPAHVAEMKVAVSENMINQFKTLLSDNHIVIEESQIDPMADLQKQLEEAKKENNELKIKSIDTDKQLMEYHKALAFNSMTEDLSVDEKINLMSLVEKLVVEDINDFKTKVAIIKDKYMKLAEVKEEENKEVVEPVTEEIENPEAVVGEEEVVVESEVNKYAPKKYTF